MPTVELIYDGDCPHVSAARAALLRAFARANVNAHWREWRGDDPESPEHVRGYGSPTILVNGRDVAGAAQGAGACCRLYPQADGSVGGVPDVDRIARALGQDRRPGGGGAATGGGWRSNLATIPGIGAALLPKIACPACWPAYAGFLSAIGLGFLLDARYLLPLTAVFLAVAVFALAFRARRRRGYAPFVMGLVASTVVLVGKFSFESDRAMYAGLVLLIAASLWNSWPKRKSGAACPSCAERAGSPQPAR